MTQTDPDVRVRIAGQDLSSYFRGLLAEAAIAGGLPPALAPSLLTVEYTDEAGGEDDRRSASFARRGPIPMPPVGGPVDLAFGHRVIGLVAMPTLHVDRPSGPTSRTQGRRIDVTATSIDAATDLESPRDDSPPPDRIVRPIVGKVAARHGNTAVVADGLADVVVPRADQTHESDLHYLSRIARDLGATFKVVGARMIFVPRGAMRTVSGAPLPLPLFLPGESDFESIRWTGSERGRHSRVEAAWHDPDAAQRRKVSVGEGTGPGKLLRKTFAD